jgi:transcriptional regulator with XRE-family HTH domain
MSQTLGARLRHRREQQGIALTTIAAQTKIKASLLAALERDDVSQWPSGIFRRSFVRVYAEAIGLDADTVVQEFQTAHPQPDHVDAAASAIAAATGDGRTSTGPPTRIGAMLRAAIGAFTQHRRGRVEVDRGAAGDPAPDEPADVSLRSPEPTSFDPDLLAVARLCTEFARIEHVDHVQPLLREAARILDASGVIVWVWDDVASHLRPALAHGYSRRVLAQIPAVERDADNPTATAFRSARVIGISDAGSGALVVPLLASTGCVGVLAIELPRGRETSPAVRAVATIYAAMLVQLTGGVGAAEVRPAADKAVSPVYSSSASMAARSSA